MQRMVGELSAFDKGQPDLPLTGDLFQFEKAVFELDFHPYQMGFRGIEAQTRAIVGGLADRVRLQFFSKY